ncbi:MAG: hypothetical protein IPN29_08880 [Saprospiraceae bacterium]|nr:hypothetical protein [Saprospiraceae bacterium]
MTKKYICIGHVCHDKTPSGFVPGGTVTYASVLAAAHGYQTSIWTSAGEDFLFNELFDRRGIHQYVLPAAETTEFENIYFSSGRSQYIRARASMMEAKYFPRELMGGDIVHLGAIANEIDFNVLPELKAGLTGASIQGCFRHWQADGKIYLQDFDWKELQGIDIVFLSLEDIEGREEVIADLLPFVGHIVLTRGSEGATVYHHYGISHSPAFPVQEKDATGAGDVFAATYLMAFSQSGDIAEATIVAHCAASYVAEGAALSSMPSPEMIWTRTIQYKALFHP